MWKWTFMHTVPEPWTMWPEETKELARDIESFSGRYMDAGEAFEEEEMER